MSDTSNVIDLLVDKFSAAAGSNSDARAALNALFARRYEMVKTAADSMASDTTAVTANPWRRITKAGTVKSIYIHSTAALTGHASNNATITVSKYDAAGANKTTLGTITTTASWVAGTSVALTLTDANLAVVEGGSLAFEIAKGSSGVAVPICTIEVLVEPS